MPITDPEAVVASCLFHPLVFSPRGPIIYQIETSRRYSASVMPLLRDANGKPVVLTEEIGIGSIVRLAIGDGLLRGVQVIKASYADPFAAEFAEAAD